MKKRGFKKIKLGALALATTLIIANIPKDKKETNLTELDTTYVYTPRYGSEETIVGLEKTIDKYTSLGEENIVDVDEIILEEQIYNFEREQELFELKLKKQELEALRKAKKFKKQAKEQEEMELKILREQAENSNSVNTGDNYHVEILKGKNFKRYILPKDKLASVAAVCMCEQGSSIPGVKFEASLICNRTDGGVNGHDPYAVSHSAWFGGGSTEITGNARIGGIVGNRGVLTQEIYDAVYDVVCNGNRVTRAVEHDCFSDIEYIENNGERKYDYRSISNRSNYVSGQTIIHNTYGATYKFLGFPTPNSGDPFGR